ncbi:NAD(P)H-binding protein [Occallatibacter savannae]|uniref:NAD(P)H-binding protein n=1 Tax=Occallatibacter savannae TaxID=1002691 RepID=UPI000D698FB1|nr:NAD(P)H-binding protein [Occallatibacter savannae]
MILITGASGNVGREVLKQAVSAGLPVRAAFQNLAKANTPAGVEAVRVDFNEPQTLKAALNGVETVFLVGPPTEELVPLERKAAEVIAQSSVRRLVKLSAMGGREATFPRQHADSEDFIRSTGVPFTFLRPNGFMQNLVHYSAPTIKTIDKFYGSEGGGRISFIDIRDIAAVAVGVLSNEGHAG